MRFRSKPSEVEAVQWTGSNWGQVRDFAQDAVEWEGARNERCLLLAGKDGAQGWVRVPTDHWIVREPGDPSDHWPVNPIYFLSKYEAAPIQPGDGPAPSAPPHDPAPHGYDDGGIGFSDHDYGDRP